MAPLVEILCRFLVEFAVLLAGRRLAGVVLPLHSFELGQRPRSEAASHFLVGVLFCLLAAVQAYVAQRAHDGAMEWLLIASAAAMGVAGLACLAWALRLRGAR